MRLYLRTARVRIGDRGFQVRTVFSIEKTEDSKSNKATVTMHNLSEDSRGFIEHSGEKTVVVAGKKTVEPGEKIIVEAGYGDRLAVLFIGDIKKVVTTRNGPEVLTTIESGDGEIQITDAHIELSLGPGATDQQIINAAVSALGISKGVIKDLPNTAYQNGFAFSGRAAGLLDMMTKKSGLVWSVQNGALQIMLDSDNTGETAVLLSSNTGLLGLPNKKEDGLEAISLLNPELRPGRLVKIVSKLLTGPNLYKATKVTHAGDTREGVWTSKVEGKVA